MGAGLDTLKFVVNSNQMAKNLLNLRFPNLRTLEISEGLISYGQPPFLPSLPYFHLGE